MNKKSFTLIELLVVIAIIGILSSLVIARFSDWGDNARIANTLQWSAGVHRTLGANLVGHWPLNGDTNDISGYSNNGTMYGFTGEPDDYWVDGIPETGNQALEFDGDDDYVECGVMNYQTFSASFWANLTYLSENQEYILATGVWSHGGWWIQTLTNSSIGIYISDKVDTSGTTIASLQYFNSWNLYTITYEGTNYKLYINDRKKIDLIPFVNLVYENERPLTIGRASNYDGVYTNGEINDVRIYDTALTAEEVSRIYAETKGKYLVEGK